jgi:hypothetical protein
MNLQELKDEIKSIGKSINFRSAHEIFNLLNSHHSLLATKIDSDNLNFMLKNFEKLAFSSPGESKTQSWMDDFEKSNNLLLFYLEKI